MSKAVLAPTNKNIRVSKPQSRVRNSSRGSVRFASGSTAKQVSPEFFESRESLYQLVDLIDYLFDGIIG